MTKMDHSSSQRTQLPIVREQASHYGPEPALTGTALKVATLSKKLIDLIHQETQLLSNRRPRDAQKLHGEKNRTIQEYRAAISSLHHNKGVLGPEGSPVRLFIRKLTDALRDALRDNARIVLRLKSVAEGLVRSVSDEVNKTQRPVNQYGRNATVVQSYTQRPTSLAINQVI